MNWKEGDNATVYIPGTIVEQLAVGRVHVDDIDGGGDSTLACKRGSNSEGWLPPATNQPRVASTTELSHRVAEQRPSAK